MPESILVPVQSCHPKFFKSNLIRRTLLSAMTISAVFSVALGTAAQTPVLTQHNDNGRTGQNLNETILTTSNVNVSQFGKLFALPVDAQVYAEPLYVPGVTINGSAHNVLIVATENDSVYAFDADSNTGANSTYLWKASMVDAAHGANPNETALNEATTINCSDMHPLIGITSTPVIDLNTKTIYLEAKSTDGTNYYHRLHSLDLLTGSEKSPGPTLIAGTVSGTGDGSSNGQIVFDSPTNALHQQSRAGLLLVNGTIFIAFASHCDYGPYHGWLFAYDESTLSKKSVYVTTPNGGLGGFWMSGSGIAADSGGNIFVATGNGDFDTVNVPARETGDTILKLGTASQNLSLLDYFTPQDQASLQSSDNDLGSGGVLLLPDQTGTFPHLLVAAGKEGRVYIVNRDQMTTNNSHYCSGCSSDPEIVEESTSGAIGGVWGMPAYWNGNIYYGGSGEGSSGPIVSIPIVAGLPNFSSITRTTNLFGFPGTTPSVSSNGSTPGSAIVWAINSSAYGAPGAAVIHAYDATNLSSELWNSAQASGSRDKAGNAVKFSVPTVSNGKVYVGTSTEVDVYGLLGTTPAITSLAPTSGRVGTVVTITGANFGATQGTSTITFNGTTAAATTWSATSITTAVPTGATSGNVVVTVGGVASNGVAFTVALPPPVINTLNPASGPTGTSVTISGSNFGSTQGTSTVTFNGTSAAAASWSATSITATVPSAATSGNVVVTVAGSASNGVAFTVTGTSPPPSISTLAPASGPVGTPVTITGANFGSTQSTSTVTFNGTTATVTSWSTTSITVTVPTAATSGNVVVTVAGAASNGLSFTVIPTITSLSPNAGTAGTAVTVIGTGFGPNQGSSSVTFNGTLATVTSWSSTSIATAVPIAATTGNIVVTVGGAASNGVNFTITLICGESGQSGTDSQNANWAFASACVTGNNSAGYAASSIQYWVGNPASASFDLGIYGDNGGTPGTLLCHTGTTTVNVSAGWNNTSLAGKGCPALNASTQYWMGYITGSNTLQQGIVSGTCPGTTLKGVYASAQQGSTSLPATFGATSGTPSCYSMYMLLSTPPTISTVSPVSGPIGTLVTIGGANFGATQGTSTITFGGVAAIATGWSSSSITATVPNGATSGNVVVTVGGVASNGVAFTVTVPTITGISPSSGTVGAPVTINGTSFGSTQSGSTVQFNGTVAAVTSWGSTSIATTVPAGAISGNVVVTVGGVASNGVAFTVTVPAPTITTIAPASGAAGSPVTISGANFGQTQGTSTVKFNGTAATVSTWSPSTLATSVPNGATTGNVLVTVGGVASNGVSFTVTPPPPTITNLSPTSGPAGTAVTVTGTNFGSTQGSSTVTFNGVAGTATSWSATSIVATVPNGATTGNIVVTVGGIASNGVTFTVTSSTPSPAISSLSPTSGLPGTAVTINGANFGATQGTSAVTFGGVAAAVTTWSATSIAATVPSAAPTGNVVVTVGGVASNGVSFTVTSICGETGQSGTDSQNANWAFGTPCVTGGDANGYAPASIEYWVGNPASTSFDLGIYADNGGTPGTLLCHTGTTTINAIAGWNNVPLAGKGCPVLNASTQYWIGYITGSNTIQQGTVSGTCPSTAPKSLYASAQQSSTALPASFGAAKTTPVCYSMYLVLNDNDPSGGSTQLIALSSNGKYLINGGTNQPVFIVGDDAFDLCCMLSSSNVSTYLNDRSGKGFNAIWMAAADNGYSSNPPANFNGNVPFDGADFTNFDANYWANIDSIITQASNLGITVFLNPFFPGNGSEPGYLSSALAASDATMSAYGTFLGNRYKGYNNIVWLLGGDSWPSTSGLYQKLNDVGAALAAADPNHLITLEACQQCATNGDNSVQAYQAQSLSVPSWLTLNWAYPQLTTTVAAAQNAYNQSPFLPPLCGEDQYELANSITVLNVRFEMYSEILSGCYVGRIFGNGAIWSFDSSKGDTCCRSGSPTWQSQLSSPGSIAQQYLGRLFRSREHWLLVPDMSHAVVTGGYGSGLTMTTAARTSDGQTVIAYIPNGNATTITVNLAKITSATSTVQAWWFNPQTAATTNLGTFPNSGTQTFTAPDSNDWVLVLDDAGANLPAPGSSSL